MEIKGTVLSISEKCVTVCNDDKKQDLDIFYRRSDAEDVKDLTVGQMVQFSVRVQSVSVNGEKLGRFWLWIILFPRKTFEEKFKGKNVDWAKRNLKQ